VNDEPGGHTQVFLPFYAAFHGSRQQHPAYYATSREPRLPSVRQRSQGHRSSHIGSELYLQLVDADQAHVAPRCASFRCRPCAPTAISR
jgi:type VI secretion system protein ImpG